jgi:hypothetical protein
MTESVMERVPASRAVLVEQIRAVGLATRRELLAVAAPLGALVLAVAAARLAPSISLQMDAESIGLNPEDLGYLALFVGLAFPLAVWKGEAPFGDTQLWSLPVDRRRHALIKVGAGWPWLMGLIATGIFCFALAALLSGGSVGVSGTRPLLLDAAGTTEAIPWSTPWWQWAIPFTAATAAYLLATALILGTEHPWRWVAGLWLGFLAIGLAGEVTEIAWIEEPVLLLLDGTDYALTGGVEALRGRVVVPGDEAIWGWHGLPTLGRWGAATAGWLGVGLVAVWATSMRHRHR